VFLYLRSEFVQRALLRRDPRGRGALSRRGIVVEGQAPRHLLCEARVDLQNPIKRMLQRTESQ
jgi:hypothetical protein